MINLSVIIPIYNVENYIVRCVNSVQSSLYNFEIILVDDGSTDNSGVIADKLVENNSNVTVYHQKNKGLSAARNLGIKKAKGDYIGFLDSDDFVIEKAYDVMLAIGYENDLDVVLGNLVHLYDNHTTEIEKPYNDSAIGKIITGKKYHVTSTADGSYTSTAPQGIYKRNLFYEQHLFFREGILHEDELWKPQILYNSQKIMHLDLPFYMHYKRKGSITTKKDKTQNAFDYIKIVYELNDFFENASYTNEEKVILNNYLVNMYLKAYYVGKLHLKQFHFTSDFLFLEKHAASIENQIALVLLRQGGKYFHKMISLYPIIDLS